MKQLLRALLRERVDGQRRAFGFLSLLSASVFLGHLAGCATSELPVREETSAVSASEMAIALLRVVCTVEDQQPYEPFSHSLGEDNIHFGLGSFETGGEPKRLAALRFLSPESRKDGWTYIVIPQGIHYLAVYPPRRTDYLTYERSLKHAPRWRMEIPPGAKLVYVGTLRMGGESSPLLVGGRILSSIRTNEMSVANDEERARELLTGKFPGLGAVQTVLMRLQEGPTILRSPLPSPAK